MTVITILSKVPSRLGEREGSGMGLLSCDQGAEFQLMKPSTKALVPESARETSEGPVFTGIHSGRASRSDRIPAVAPLNCHIEPVFRIAPY